VGAPDVKVEKINNCAASKAVYDITHSSPQNSGKGRLGGSAMIAGLAHEEDDHP
jgi:hypothetical protein